MMMILFALFLLNSYQCLDMLTPMYGLKNYTQFQQGNINIMISVPHNGYLTPVNFKTVLIKYI